MDNFEDSRIFCESLKAGYIAPPKYTEHIPRKLIFSDLNYCCIGAQPCRAQLGLRKRSYHHDKMDLGHWDQIVGFMKRGERAYESFMDTVKIQGVNHDRQLIFLKTMTSSDKGTMN